MTEPLYYADPRLAEFTARALAVEEADGAWNVELDRTAFYPEGGGQPADRGTLGGAAVRDVRREGERIIHVLAAAPQGDPLAGRIDWARRWDFMQQHTGQHLLSNVLLAVCGAPTVSVHLGDDLSTIELDVPAIADSALEAAEDRAAELIAADLPVTARWVDDEELAGLALRRPTSRKGRVRLVEIGDAGPRRLRRPPRQPHRRGAARAPGEGRAHPRPPAHALEDRPPRPPRLQALQPRP